MTAPPLVLLTFLALQPPAPPASTQPAHPVDSLSLSQLLADVEANSPVSAAARARVDASERRVDAAGAWSDPFIAAGPDEYALDAEPPMLRIELTQTIPLPGKLAPGVDAARAYARGAAAERQMTSKALRLAALLTFFEALHADAERASTAAQLPLLDDMIASATARYAAGADNHLEVLSLKAERARLTRDALVQRRRSLTYAARLDELRGREPRPRELELVDDGADRERPLPRSLEEALRDQPELARATAGVDAADANARAAGNLALPDVMVQGMWMQSFRADEPSTLGAMVGVSVPLFSWLQQAPAATDAAQRERLASEAERRGLQLQLQSAWEAASLALRDAQDTLRLYDDDVIPATAAALDSARRSYAARSTPLSEVLTLMRTLSTLQLERHQAELTVRVAEAQLRDLLSTASPPQQPQQPQQPTPRARDAPMRARGAAGMRPMNGM